MRKGKSQLKFDRDSGNGWVNSRATAVVKLTRKWGVGRRFAAISGI